MHLSILNPLSYPLPPSLDDRVEAIYAHLKDRFLIPDCEVELAIVNEEEIRSLNATYRNQDKVTDVLSFPVKTESHERFLGAIYFCYSEVINRNEDFLSGFCYLFIHSFLHLLGYEHGEEMFSLQDEIFSRFF
ncbi:conserved hypothetical protein [Mycoplasma haemofelis str. Langford 1]|uniref:Endoribonuclease YbeY n=2 Tax=Mycoplasma haemofelis TaxID=29501 RepID=F6FHF5_MYCHI|nr:rRNA maturation RNase YbeY [Mycoplasma haemofelis]AEG73785.1 metalloprotein, YbeY/UPF0054 family [Mycoplasma haemofelis Ohio2]CBY93490.1 conserved hypothetical protein [Mycoplasma haemofelis str. Langford 1]